MIAPIDVGYEQMEINEELACIEFIDFIHLTLVRGSLGQETALRLADALMPFDSTLAKRLRNETGLDADVPVAPGLRTVHDFQPGQSVRIKTPEKSHQVKGEVLGEMPGLVTIQGRSFIYLIEPTYIGLFTDQEYAYYDSQRPGSGFLPTKTFANLEITRFLSYLHIGSAPDEEMVSKVKRTFNVRTAPHGKY